MLGPNPIDELVVPDGTTVQEHDVVVDGDVLVGGQSTVELGVRGRSVVAGERVSFAGDIEADGDCRLDMWCDVDGNVLASEDAYLGERVHITGRLVVGGDLDIGDDVDIEEGFEASGWIVIRNPMPTITFFVVYLTHLLQIGEEEEAEELAAEFAADGDAQPLTIPRSGSVSDDAWRVSTPATIGDGCRLHGNIRATSIDVGAENNIFGSLRAQDDVSVDSDTKIHGDVTTRDGDVRIEADATVLGDVSGQDVHVHPDADVDGVIRARGEMHLGSRADRDPE
ncbi:acyltransferase [Halobacterium sp. R2-5]|uniref:acyltransferase n=1 Tax=Halobacterium sp. R2-5 TaxID=2715751 RepID=UPI0014249F55|nr:acyltransferase [Halobacterium sp. R2-5]NIB99049.1 acyltransferase [Halobacterium sp. R2-5]